MVSGDEEGDRDEDGGEHKDEDEHGDEDRDSDGVWGWGQEDAVPLGSVSPQPVVTQVMPPGKSSVGWGRQTGDTRADSRAGVASLSRVMSSRMVSMLNLGFLKTWSGWHCVPGTGDSTGTNRDHGD